MKPFLNDINFDYGNQNIYVVEQHKLYIIIMFVAKLQYHDNPLPTKKSCPHHHPIRRPPNDISRGENSSLLFHSF